MVIKDRNIWGSIVSILYLLGFWILCLLKTYKSCFEIYLPDPVIAFVNFNGLPTIIFMNRLIKLDESCSSLLEPLLEKWFFNVFSLIYHLIDY